MLLVFATSPGGTLSLKGSDPTVTPSGLPSLALSGVGWSIFFLSWMIPLLAH